MNPLKRLVEELQRPPTVSGRVVRIQDGSLVVKTPQGVVIVPVVDQYHYSVGDSLMLSNTTIVGRGRDFSTLPVYYV